MTFASEPLDVQQPSDEPASPEDPQTWTPRFKFLVALVALIGLAATLLDISGTPLGTNPSPSTLGQEGYALSANRAAMVINCVFVVVGVAGLWFTRSALLRTACIVQVIAALGAIMLEVPAALVALIGFQAWILSFYTSFAFLYVPPFMPLFEFALILLGLLSQLCFSYGLARWQSSDKGYIWLQIVVTVGLGSIIFQTSAPASGSSWAFVLLAAGSAYVGIAELAWWILRPACWKASPLIVLCMTTGLVVSYLFYETIERFMDAPGSITQLYQISSAINQLGSTLIILGILLLIQRARGHKAPERSFAEDLAHLGADA